MPHHDDDQEERQQHRAQINQQEHSITNRRNTILRVRRLSLILVNRILNLRQRGVYPGRQIGDRLFDGGRNARFHPCQRCTQILNRCLRILCAIGHCAQLAGKRRHRDAW